MARNLEIANLFAEITGKEPENIFLDEIQNSKTFSRRSRRRRLENNSFSFPLPPRTLYFTINYNM